MSESRNLVFVVGVFRSGTSQLCSLLNQNPNVALMYEGDIWNFPRGLLAYRFSRDWVQRVEFYNQTLSRHGMVSRNDFSALNKVRTPADLYRVFGERKGASVCGEKSPFYCSRLERLHNLYPEAAFIIVWRNPVEVYRSVRKAAQTSRFFGKNGMLHRLVYLQEQGIRQTDLIEAKGARVFRVDYANMVDNTEEVCRNLSAFLKVPFDAQMLQLNRADLSAVYKAPHHAFLRRGIIERQVYTETLLPASAIEKLERYRNRWLKQQAKWLKPESGPSQNVPGMIEFTCDWLVGRAFTFYDSLVRAVFEFMPLPWLRVYRLLKIWIINPPSGDLDEPTSIVADFRKHWQSILTAATLLAAIGFIQHRSNPHLLFILFYSMPCMLLALVVNYRWVTLFALASSIMSPMIQYEGDADYRSIGVFLWNFITRFILLEFLILMMGRIRAECSRTAANQ